MPFKTTWRNGVAYLSGSLNGQRIRKSLGTSDKKFAEELKAFHEARIRRAAIYGVEAETTFAEAYLLYHKLGKNERGYLGPIVKALGKSRLRDVTPARIKDLANELFPNAKPQTWNRYVIVPASAVINNAHQHGLCPPIRVERFKAVGQLVKTPVDREWIDRFSGGAAELYGEEHDHLGPRLGAFALFMFTTAARPTEAILLEPKHLRLADRLATSARPTKNGEYREFYLTEEVTEILRALTPKRIRWGQYRGERRVFGWADKMGPLGPWKAACKAAGLAYRSPYEAGRHSFATEAVTRQERNVVTSATVGGWKDPGVMLKHYSHPENLNEFAEDVFGKSKRQDCRNANPVF
jgi:integrase